MRSLQYRGSLGTHAESVVSDKVCDAAQSLRLEQKGEAYEAKEGLGICDFGSGATGSFLRADSAGDI